MKAVLLAGGLGTRISEETTVRPKPLIEVGGKPLLWHIMKIYAAGGITDFIVCCGYKGYLIKEYFVNYYLHNADVTVDLGANSISVHRNASEPWKITLVDTGEATMTGGRIKRIHPYVEGETFCATYGDGVADIDIAALVRFHDGHGATATMTTVQPPGRFGASVLDGDRIIAFEEKPRGDNAWINGGFFVLGPGVFDVIDGDETLFEREPLDRLVAADQLRAFKHRGFWQPVDTLRDKIVLEELWQSGKAPWKSW